MFSVKILSGFSKTIRQFKNSYKWFLFTISSDLAFALPLSVGQLSRWRCICHLNGIVKVNSHCGGMEAKLIFGMTL